MVGFRTRLQLLQGGRFYAGKAYIQDQVEAFPEVVGPLHNHIQGLEAFRRHMALGCYCCLSAIEVEPYKNPELVIQMLSPVTHFSCLAATLRPTPSLGSRCDAGNICRHIRQTPRYERLRLLPARPPCCSGPPRRPRAHGDPGFALR